MFDIFNNAINKASESKFYNLPYLIVDGLHILKAYRQFHMPDHKRFRPHVDRVLNLMEMADYKEIKRNLEPKIEALITQQLSYNQIEVEYRSYLKKAVTAIKNLGHLFDNANINGKQDIIRSTLKENCVFSEGKVRTKKLNYLLSLITYGDGRFGGFEKRKGSNFCSLSAMVPGMGLEPIRLRTRPSNVLVYQFQHPGRV